MKSEIKAALFDLDGTLVQTEELKGQALARAVQHFGGNVPFEIYKDVMGQSWESVTSYFFKEAGLSLALDEFDPVFKEIYKNLIASDLQTESSTDLFLQKLKSKNIPIGVVSSASNWMIEKVLSKAQFSVSFDLMISGTDVIHHKPHPEAYLKALSRLALPASDVIVFEDSQAGFESANRAGLRVYGRKHDFNQPHDFSLCDKTFTSFDELDLI